MCQLSELMDAVENLRCSVVLFPSSFAWEQHKLLDRIEQAGSRAVMILEPGAEVDDSVSVRLQGMVTRSVAAPQLIDCRTRLRRAIGMCGGRW